MILCKRFAMQIHILSVMAVCAINIHNNLITVHGNSELQLFLFKHNRSCSISSCVYSYAAYPCYCHSTQLQGMQIRENKLFWYLAQRRVEQRAERRVEAAEIILMPWFLRGNSGLKAPPRGQFRQSTLVSCCRHESVAGSQVPRAPP